MFNNIGFKIKMLATILTMVGFVLSGVSGICLLFFKPVFGVLAIVVGCLVSWINSFVLYGFGELIVNSEEIKEELSRIKVSGNNE